MYIRRAFKWRNIIKNRSIIMSLINLNKNINITFDKKNSILKVKGFFGILLYKLPSFYFYKISKNIIYFLFINKFLYLSFIKHFLSLYKRISFIYSVKLRLKGLGYRIRKITKYLYYFFFNYTNMFYFYIPKNILLKWYKKRILLISNNFSILKLIFSNILMLKKIGPYRLRGLRYSRQIIFIKKRIKKK